MLLNNALKFMKQLKYLLKYTVKDSKYYLLSVLAIH